MIAAYLYFALPALSFPPLFLISTMVRLRTLASLISLGIAPSALAWNHTTLALGDSITYGWESTDGNGYRLGLKNLVAAAGNTLTYIGSIQAGTMVSRFRFAFLF